MQSLRQSAPRVRTAVSRSTVCRQARRFAHDEHGAHGHAAPANESFGRGFFIALAALPLSIAVYRFTAAGGPDNEPLFTRLIKSYTTREEKWDRRNDLHTQAVELAGRDRALFFNDATSRSRHVEMRFPEMLNTGSPFNVPAGHGYSNIDAAIEKYQKQNYEENARKYQALKENRIPAEHPLAPEVAYPAQAADVVRSSE